MKSWLVLIYRIPREPAAGRVYIWRKLKQLGAVALQDAAWVLPSTDRTREQFQWLAAEVTEKNGEAILWEADQLYATNIDSLRNQFIEPVEAEYREIQKSLKRKDCDLTALSKRFQDIVARDYFETELGRQTREKLLRAAEGRSA